MTIFFHLTSSSITCVRPSYYVAHCLFEHLDCKSLWRRKVTKMGTCIEFDPSLAVNQYNKSLEQELVKDMAFEVGDNQLRYEICTHFQNWKYCILQNLISSLRTVAMLIGLNSSDFTYGWNGYINGLTLFYSHYTDTVPEEIHSIPITPG